jgi:hypothetical protein
MLGKQRNQTEGPHCLSGTLCVGGSTTVDLSLDTPYRYAILLTRECLFAPHTEFLTKTLSKYEIFGFVYWTYGTYIAQNPGTSVNIICLGEGVVWCEVCCSNGDGVDRGHLSYDPLCS